MSKHFSRRQFLNTTLGFSSLALAGAIEFKKNNQLLSFSTLGCPDWKFDEILNFASNHGFNGIEIRGIQRQMDLTKVPEFSNEKIPETLRRLKEKKLSIVNLGSSTQLHHADPVERKKHLDEAKSFINLAHDLKCPFIRVFPNNLPKDGQKEETFKLISDGLLELGNYSNDKDVMVLMETHGDLVQTADLEKVMGMVNHPKVGLVWDIVNMWTITKEDPQLMYDKLKKYIYHTHIKDAKMVDGKPQYVFLGKGDTPILKAVQILAKNKYKGYYSFEWEKLWHPEIGAPEAAIGNYSTVMRNLLH
jgi:sugar phosphate isomerase/epimerase